MSFKTLTKSITSAIKNGAEKLGKAAVTGADTFISEAARQMQEFSGATLKTENKEAEQFYIQYFDTLQNEVRRSFKERPALACDFIGSFCMTHGDKWGTNKWYKDRKKSWDMVSGAHFRYFPLASINIPQQGLVWSMSSEVISAPIPNYAADGVSVELLMPSSLNTRYYGRLYKEQFNNGMLRCGALNGLSFIISLYRRNDIEGGYSEIIPFIALKNLHLSTLWPSNISTYDNKDFLRVKGGIYGSDFEYFHYHLDSDYDYDFEDIGQSIGFN